MPRESIPTAAKNSVRLRALAMRKQGIGYEEIRKRLHCSVMSIKQWEQAEQEKPAPKNNVTPAPYRTGLAGWGRWR